MGSYRCQCIVGYKGTGLQDECEDANECIPGLNECPHYSHCVNTRGSYECSCDDGFTEIGGTGSTLQCDDIDECTLTPPPSGTPGRTIDCDPNASCINTVGSYTCKCNIGYQDGAVTNPNTIHNYTYNDYKETLNNFKVPTGIHCVDVDECATERIGDYTVIYLKKLNGYLSLLRNLPKRNLCHSFATCSNTLGTYTCQCDTGYKDFGSGDPGTDCQDINECTSGTPCGTNELCQNAIGSYRCGCMQGYIKDDHDQSCIDFDECEQGTHTCHAESQVLFSNKPFFIGMTAPNGYYGP